MVRKYEQLQLTLAKKSPYSQAQSDHQPGYGEASFAMGRQEGSLRGQEDATSRFIRELREKQSMQQDTQNMYAAGPPAHQASHQINHGLQTSGMTREAPMLAQEQAKN